MFEIGIRRKFTASHALTNYKGTTEALHEHLWQMEAIFASEKLDDAGCVLDFVEIDRTIDKIIFPFSGKAIHESPMFADLSPSAENIARYLFESIKMEIEHPDVLLKKIVVWEDTDHFASYSK